MRTLDQILKTPVLLLTMDEIARMREPERSAMGNQLSRPTCTRVGCEHEWIGISTPHGYAPPMQALRQEQCQS